MATQPLTRSIFPGSIPAVDMEISSYLPISDQVNLSQMNRKARQILSNDHFRKIFENGIKIFPNDVQKSIGFNKPETAIVHKFLWDDHGEAIKLNRMIQQIVASHPTCGYKLLCKVLLESKNFFKIPQLQQSEIQQLHAHFVANLDCEIIFLKEKNTQIYGNYDKDPNSLIHKLELFQKGSNEELEKSLNEEKEKSQKIKQHIETFGLNTEMYGLIRQFVDTLNGKIDQLVLSTNYKKLLIAHRKFKEEAELIFKEISVKINEKMCGKEKKIHTEIAEIFFKNAVIQSFRTYSYHIDATGILNKSLLSSLESTSKENIDTFFKSHQKLLQEIKSQFRLLQCQDCLDEMLIDKTNFCDNPQFIIKEQNIQKIRNLMNDCLKGKDIWQMLWERCANGNTDDPSWAENQFANFLKPFRNILCQTIHSFFRDSPIAYNIQKN